MKLEVMVLGAGMVGTCTALQLALRGHAVALVDRREPGRETSFGNAGLIQREAVEPYAFPRELAKLARVAARQGADVHWHADAMPALAQPLARYWANSGPARYPALAAAHAALIAHCLVEHETLVRQAGASDLVRREGYRTLYRSPETFDEAVAHAHRIERDTGVRHTVLDGAALARAEPGLRRPLPGAIHWLDPWSVSDPGELVRRYARLFVQAGGRLVRGDAGSLQSTAGGWRLGTEEGALQAPHAVLALGPWSATLAARFGQRIPLFAKRGYHRHYRAPHGPSLTSLDADRGYVLAPMQAGLRLTTGAEFARLDAPPSPVQLRRAERLAGELFDLGEPVEDTPWLGARPCTPDMLPVTGAAPGQPGLWMNFGHAHQGFTLGPVSGRLLAELMEGGPTFVDAAPYAPERFG